MTGISPWNRIVKSSVSEVQNVVSRSEYRDILLARMAGGDLYAAESLAKIRRVDMMLDAFREKPIYGGKVKTLIQ